MPIDHVKLPVSDLAASRAFYAAALAPFGYVLVYDGESSLGFRRGDGGEEDEPLALELTEAPSVPSHVAFTSSSTEQVDAFHTLPPVAPTTARRESARTAFTTTRRSCETRTGITSKRCTTVRPPGACLRRSTARRIRPAFRRGAR